MAGHQLYRVHCEYTKVIDVIEYIRRSIPNVTNLNLYNNTCSFCIFVGRELCVIKVHTHG